MRSWKTWIVVAVVVAFLVPAAVASAQQTEYVKVNCGKVLKVVSNTVVARIDGTNEVKVFKNVSPDIKFVVNGKDTDVYGLRPGMQACSYRLEEVPEPVLISITENEVEQVVDEPDEYDAPPPAPAPAPAPEPAPAPAPAALPHTASSLPTAGMLGILLLGLSLGIAVIRRF